MDLFIEIAGPLAVVAVITSLVVCTVDGIKRAPIPYSDYTRTNILSLTATVSGIVGATLAGWSWYRYVILSNSDGRLISVVTLIIIAAIAAAILGFGGYQAGRVTYRVSRAFRQRILRSMSLDEQRSLVPTFSDDILNAELNQRLEAGIQFTLSDEGQRSLMPALDSGILSAEVGQRIDAGTLSVEEQRSLAQIFPGNIFNAEVLARMAVGKLGAEEQRSLVQALPNNIFNAEVLARMAVGKLGANEVGSVIKQAPRQSVLTAFCDLNLSSRDLTPYYLGRLAKLFGLNRLITMVSGEGPDNLDDDDLKRFADFFDLARLVDMLLIQINTREERSFKRLSTIDLQIGELNSALRESDRRFVELQERLSVRSQMDGELPDALRGVRLGSLTGNEVERLKEMAFTTEEREELFSELMKVLAGIAQSNEKNDRLGQRHDAEVREQDGLSQMRPIAQTIKDLIVFYGTRQ